MAQKSDGVKRHKPSLEAYAYVERELGAKPSQLCLIACHTWDTLGAVAAGWEAALIKRVGSDVLARSRSGSTFKCLRIRVAALAECGHSRRLARGRESCRASFLATFS
jgi:hypothetical protein